MLLFIGKMCICLSLCAVSIVMGSAQVEQSTLSPEDLTGQVLSHAGTLNNHQKLFIKMENFWKRLKRNEIKLKTLFEDKKAKTDQKGDQDFEELNTKLKETEKQVSTLHTELQELKTNYRALQNNNISFRDNMMQKDNQISVLQEQVTTLQTELQELNTNYRALQNNNTILRDNMMQFSQTITECCGKRKLSESEVPNEVDARPGVVRVACSVHNNATIATTKWTREPGKLPQQAIERKETGELIIPDARPVDSGLYTCHVTDSTGNTRDATTRVNIGNLPEVRIEHNRQTVNQGTSAQLRCIATGDPQPEISWSKINEELGPQVIIEGGLLQINNVVINDGGMYVCEARNNVGKARTSAIIEVESTPPARAYPTQPDYAIPSPELDFRSSCNSQQFQCDNGKYIELSRYCNGVFDCSDRSDEINCPSHLSNCEWTQYQCDSGECIDQSLECDNKYDCPDASDELDCEVCGSFEFQCGTGECVSRAVVCDGRSDCLDRSDEDNCYGTQPPSPTDLLNLRTYPDERTLKQNRKVIFQCRDKGPLRKPVRWVRAGGQRLPPGTTDVRGRLTMLNIQVEHSGTYYCEAQDISPNTPGYRKAVTLRVEA